MFNEWKKFVLAAFAAALVLGLAAPPAGAIWHVLLDEHFNKDQQQVNLRWPWMTDLRNGRRWHWNPRIPYPNTERNTTDYCWGIQDLIYNIRVTPQDDIHQALWCAYTNRGDINNPRWPDENDYMPNQNAWVWWGEVNPVEARVSLERAVSANVSFWLYLDLTNYARDSLSFFALTDPNLLTTTSANTFFTRVPVGKTYSHRINNDWVWQTCYLDSLHVGARPDSLISVLGQPRVFIGFVWQSDQYAVQAGDKGAFIDDVIFSWDDGLFDILPIANLFGYRVNQDSITWNHVTPRRDEQVYFKSTYRVIGIGETPEFTIQLVHNDELMYSSTLTRTGSSDTTYTVFADTLWTAVSGNHSFRWEFDTPVADSGSVEEGNERNNVLAFSFDIVENPPPEVEIALTDTVHQVVVMDGLSPINLRYTISDPGNDNRFNLILYWTADTTGLAADPTLVSRYGYVGRALGVPRGTGTFMWQAGQPAVANSGYTAVVDSFIVFKIVAVVTDNYPGNRDIKVSPNDWMWRYPRPDTTSAPRMNEIPTEFCLMSAFPNPFNDAVTVDYSLPYAALVSLDVFDMAGRWVANLRQGRDLPGRHTLNWQPQDAPAGIYLVRMESPGKTALRKVVYMP